MIELRQMFQEMIAKGASDLHIVVGAPPQLRVHGDLRTTDGWSEDLTSEHTREIVYGILTNEQRQRLEEQWEIDFSYTVPGMARWRVNAFFQKGAIGAAFRIIPEKIKPLSDLGVPDALYSLCNLPRGLVLVTGPTGSGKSTTLASMIDVINEQRAEHILTVEDPVEFVHMHKNCIVNQREVGADTEGFARALKSALRQDPDVILVGEMRDLETIQTALTAAETGHLVFGTLHTNGAAKTIDRIIDVFPPHSQNQVRTQLASALQGVVTQTLVPTKDGAGRVVAAEVMIPNSAIRNLIREAKIFQIPSVMQTSMDEGMQTLDSSLATLVRANLVSREEALKRCAEEAEFDRLLASGAGAPLPGQARYTPPERLRLQRKFAGVAAAAEASPVVPTEQPVPVGAPPTVEFRPLDGAPGTQPPAPLPAPPGVQPQQQPAPAQYQPQPGAMPGGESGALPTPPGIDPYTGQPMVPQTPPVQQQATHMPQPVVPPPAFPEQPAPAPDGLHFPQTPPPPHMGSQ